MTPLDYTHARLLGYLIGLTLLPIILAARIYLSPDPSARWAVRSMWRGLVGGRRRRMVER